MRYRSEAPVGPRRVRATIAAHDGDLGTQQLLTKDSAAVDWIARAQELAPMIEAAADRTERERRIPADVLAAMHEARLFHMLLPLSLGGGAADLVTFNQVIETLAAADASPAWCLAQSRASSHAAGFLDPEIAREVFGAPRRARGLGTAGRHRQGARGRRRLPRHRQMAVRQRQRQRHLDGRAFDGVRADDKPRLDAAGRPVNRTVLFRRQQATIHDTWHVIGLRGTASNDYEVADLFVREPYTTWRDSASDRREDGPLYNIPLLTLYGIGFSGVALGIAARASTPS